MTNPVYGFGECPCSASSGDGIPGANNVLALMKFLWGSLKQKPAPKVLASAKMAPSRLHLEKPWWGEVHVVFMLTIWWRVWDVDTARILMKLGFKIYSYTFFYLMNNIFTWGFHILSLSFFLLPLRFDCSSLFLKEIFN